MLVSIPSNRPKRLRTTLLSVIEGIRKERVNASVLVVDGSQEAAENRSFAQEAIATYGIPVDVVPEVEFQQTFRDFAFLFTGP
ncbi:MAG TPA: hypothetical protein VI874_00380, partial [Candidatus Norongarragalinales archaeon]|nr:hypothetical protein [Candidatus Norongarragalinales archaeon]